LTSIDLRHTRVDGWECRSKYTSVRARGIVLELFDVSNCTSMDFLDIFFNISEMGNLSFPDGESIQAFV
jgi:hypothetical protein